MPFFVVESQIGLTAETKAKLASEITRLTHDIIESELDLISVMFHDLPPDSTYRAGQPTKEAVLLGYIRKGRKLETVQRLALSISKCWSEITGMSENEIELAIAEYPAEVTFRYGARLPEPSYV
jgi:phenylpyruvate tautomerase PptA (4-oxalocrotonate tautomerase family)